MIKITKTHETVFFEAVKDDISGIIELNINHDTKTYNLCTKYQESVSFQNDTIEVAKLKLKALKSAINYIETVLKDGQ